MELSPKIWLPPSCLVRSSRQRPLASGPCAGLARKIASMVRWDCEATMASSESFGAFRTMTEQIGAARLVSQLSGGDHLTSGVRPICFAATKAATSSSHGTSMGDCVAARQHSKRQRCQAIDVNGQSVDVSVAEDGRPKLSVSSAPIYVSGLPAVFHWNTAEPLAKMPQRPRSNLRKEN